MRTITLRQHCIARPARTRKPESQILLITVSVNGTQALETCEDVAHMNRRLRALGSVRSVHAWQGDDLIYAR